MTVAAGDVPDDDDYRADDDGDLRGEDDADDDAATCDTSRL